MIVNQIKSALVFIWVYTGKSLQTWKQQCLRLLASGIPSCNVLSLIKQKKILYKTLRYGVRISSHLQVNRMWLLNWARWPTDVWNKLSCRTQLSSAYFIAWGRGPILFPITVFYWLFTFISLSILNYQALDKINGADLQRTALWPESYRKLLYTFYYIYKTYVLLGLYY